MGWEQKVTIDGLPYYYNAESEEITWDKPEALMSAAEKEEEAGDWVWIPHPTKLWQPARVIGEDEEGGKKCQTRDGKIAIIPKGNIVSGELTNGKNTPVDFWPVKLSQLNRPEEDLVQMTSVNDASIINNIMLRYEKDELYTWVGAAKSVLISVNPYKKLDLYNSNEVDKYRNKPPNTHLKPHVFDIANDSYNSLLFDNFNQSILISGESGAGKTVCTKQCLDFLAQVAGSEQSTIEEKILKANPLLEAFGNAQTIRNNNSSRFGKWIEVYFSIKDRKIVSGKITNYLLEKSRLVYQAKGERNYHVFYQLTGSSDLKSKYSLKGPENYHYTNQSGLYKAHLIDDQEDLVSVMEAFNLLNFSPEEQEFVLSTTAGILTLGNVAFNAKAEKGGVSGSSIADPAPVKTAAALLGFAEDELTKCLTYRSISVRGQTSTIPLDPQKAESAKDSLAMGVYSRLFDYLVQKINESLAGEEGKFIGVLDIFGFEIFDQNSFEQLCINFANEKLQQQFNRTTFKEEEELYRNEGIKYKEIVFIDNQVVLDMIEKPPLGVLPMLDDECRIPEGSDKKYMNKLEDAHGGNAKFQTDKQRKLLDSFNFEIVHYAGIVKYNGEHFMQKNTDNLYQDMYDLCTRNQNKLFSAMFPATENRQLKSLSYQFRVQLNELMAGLKKTDSRYIRCVKPNGEQKPNSFDSYLVIEQLRYSGVFEAVDIRKQGYPFRFKFPQFACRYSCVNLTQKYKTDKADFRDRAEEILNVSKQDFSGCVFGKSMVLFKTKEYSTLELLRQLALETLIPKMQAVMRGHLAREMKRRCLALDADLKKMIKVGNDLAGVTAAIDAVNPKLDHFLSLFEGVFPCSLPRARALKGELQEFVKAEKKLEDLLSKDPNKVYYELETAIEVAEALKKRKIKPTEKQVKLIKDAVDARKNCTLGKIDAESESCLKALDLQRMRKLSEEAAKYNHTTPTIVEINKILKRIKEIDRESEASLKAKALARMRKVLKEAKEYRYSTKTLKEIEEVLEIVRKIDVESEECLGVLDFNRMAAVPDEAAKYNHSSPTIQEIVRIIALPEIDRVRLELEKAKEMKDEKRRIHREIRLFNMELDNTADKYSNFTAYSGFRDPMEYAKSTFMGKLFGAQKKADEMKVWTKSLTPTSLTRLTVEGPEAKPIIKEAKAISKAVRQYMGDKPLAANETEFGAAASVATIAARHEKVGMVEEAYFQVLKQINQNPEAGSAAKGFELLAVLLGTILPKEKVLKLVLVFLKKQGQPVQKYKAIMHTTMYGGGKSRCDATSAANLVKELKDGEGRSRFSIAEGDFTGPHI